jgi:hypothetical protein
MPQKVREQDHKLRLPAGIGHAPLMRRVSSRNMAHDADPVVRQDLGDIAQPIGTHQ